MTLHKMHYFILTNSYFLFFVFIYIWVSTIASHRQKQHFLFSHCPKVVLIHYGKGMMVFMIKLSLYCFSILLYVNDYTMIYTMFTLALYCYYSFDPLQNYEGSRALTLLQSKIFILMAETKMLLISKNSLNGRKI